MLVLLTGIPAVGKTAVAAALRVLNPQRFLPVHFALLIFDAIQERLIEPGITYEHFKANSAYLVTAQDIAAATSRLLAAAADANLEQIILVDSHAVSVEQYGFRATPDDPDVLQRLKYALIIHLYAEPRTVIERSRVRRHPAYVNEREVALLEHLQMSTSIYYAGVVGCHLHLVDATGPLDAVTATVEEVLRVAT